MHGRHADPILEQLLGSASLDDSDAVEVSGEEWIQASGELLVAAGDKYLGAVVRRLSKNIENQEMTRGVLQDLQPKTASKPANNKLESMLMEQL